jgi:seryl-tRNA synthetase
MHRRSGPAKRIEKHTTRKGGDADDLTIIEELHNRILKQNEQIERLKNEKAALAEKISRNYPSELLKAVNAIKEGLTEKKHKIEKIEKGLATLDDIFSILTN